MTASDMLHAAVPVCDELGHLQLLLNKARTVHEEVNQEFFRFPATDGLSDVDKATILYNYDTAGVKADIVDDYLCQLEEVLKPLTESVTQLYNQLRKEVHPDA